MLCVLFNYYKMSKCEKFGYGMILAQLSCSSAGIVALERAGVPLGMSSSFRRLLQIHLY